MGCSDSQHKRVQFVFVTAAARDVANTHGRCTDVKRGEPSKVSALSLLLHSIIILTDEGFFFMRR